MEDIKRLNELRRIRKYLIGLFAVFIILPIFLGPFLILNSESKINSQLDDYWEAFTYNYAIITSSDLINATVISNEGKIVVGAFSWLYLVFFGFITAIILTSIEIQAIKKGL